MKTTTPKSPKPSRNTKRSFTWGVQTTDISFMRLTEAESALEGCGGCSDCSAISKFDKRRPKRAGNSA